MPSINLPYIDVELERMAAGEEPPGYWRAFHWGLFSDPDVDDDDPERYFAAGEALTERILTLAEVGDERRILDVGCGFGGTLDHVAGRNNGCTIFGLNIDERQLRQARVLLGAYGRAAGSDTPFIVGDGSCLPVASGVLDHVLAVECVFHFPSRKSFFREAARVLRPGGTLGISDFVLAPGALMDVGSNVDRFASGDWYGQSSRPLTSKGYARLARSAGFDVIEDEDITPATMPTYPALRRIYREAGLEDGVATVDGCEALARAGGWEYHVLAFRRRERSDDATDEPA